MATWRIRLRPGTFRGVPFEYIDQEYEGGRRVQTRAIPTADAHVSEDLGRAPVVRHVTAFVIGDQVTVLRDALVAVLEQPGPGTLGLAMWPDTLMHATSFLVRESNRRLGYCEVDISFVEASRSVQPTISIDTGAALLGAATGAVSSALSLFNQGWSIVGAAAIAATAAAGQVSGVASALDGLIPVGAETLNAADFRDAVDLLADPSPTLMANPASLASAVQSVFTAYCAAECESDRAEQTLSRLESFAVPLSPAPLLVSGAAEDANAEALTRLVRQFALIERVRVARLVPLASRDDARALEERLVAALSDEVETVANLAVIEDVDDGVYQALTVLKAAVVSHLEERAASLEPLVAYRRAGIVSSLALSYALYGTIGSDGARAGEVAARNKAIHPGFLPEEGQALAA